MSPVRTEEAARSLGSTPWQVLRRVIIPLVKPGIIAGSILVFIPSLGAYVTPRVLGGGKKLFADGSAPHSFKLTRSRVTPNGVIVGHYEREGEIRIGDTAPDAPSEREIARRKRMKREG